MTTLIGLMIPTYTTKFGKVLSGIWKSRAMVIYDGCIIILLFLLLIIVPEIYNKIMENNKLEDGLEIVIFIYPILEMIFKAIF